MRFLKIFLLVDISVLILVMAAATLVESRMGTFYTALHIYGSWWFCLLWGLFALVGSLYIVGSRMRRWSLLVLHFSWLVILAGALVTHLTSYRGSLLLQPGKPAESYVVQTSATQYESRRLPFSVTLDGFSIVEHPGTTAAADYVSRFTIRDGSQEVRGQVSMNHVFTYRGVRFYQSGYGQGGSSSTLSINSDPLGIPLTYTGYGLLLVSLLWILLDPRGTFRQRLRQLNARRLVAFGLFFFLPLATQAQPAVPQSTADAFGRLFLNYDNRICPMDTYALDFLQKVYGHRSYKGLSPSRVLLSWTFFPDEWDREPFVHVKSKAVRNEFGLPEYASVGSFFSHGDYLLGPYAYDYAQGQRDALHKACADIDSKLQIIMSLRTLQNFTCFPQTQQGVTTWYSPFDRYPASLSSADVGFMRSLFPYLLEQARRGDYATVEAALGKLSVYQRRHGGASVPTEVQVRAERIYNALPFTTMLFMVNLTMGLLTLLLFVLAQNKLRSEVGCRWAQVALDVQVASFLILTGVLALRWKISGTVPMANGYETLLTIAWMSQCAALLFVFTKGCRREEATDGCIVISLTQNCSLRHFVHRHRQSPRRITPLGMLMTVFGFLLSGFSLLVSHLGMMDPAIGPLMPVLNSPLLSIHVSVMMVSYALLAVTFLCGVTGLLLPRMAERLQVLSQVFLYPAVATLAIGIFLGAVWANVSWGCYWSWDPKETWALITLLLYSAALHTRSLPSLQRPRRYHVYMVVCFLSIVMTYFGVNYFLTGMHSYA